MTFAPGDEDISCLNVTVHEDNRVEKTELFILSLTKDDPVKPSTTCTVTLLDSSGEYNCSFQH